MSHPAPSPTEPPVGRPPDRPPLRRSRDDRIIAGVCGGLAAWLGWTPFRVRLLYVLVSILSAAFPGIAVYIVLWVVIPGPEE
jgi:phage shock protein PspC (stress-responsive transcriptional regulator)